MPITETDIKLMASARLDDSDEGGGRMSGTVIIDGQENNLFPDISELDRVYGRVNLRKAFPAVLTPDTDTYFGCNLIVSEAPTDPDVHITLFTTNDPADKRPQAQDYVERYVAEGPLSEMKLLGDHFTGQQLVLCYQRIGAALPEIGEVYVLSEEPAGTVLGSQFVRILDVESETVEYVDSNGVFLATQIVLTLTTSLTRDFPGGVPSRLSSYQPDTKIRRASAVDAARYFGIRPTIQPANIGDLTVQVDSLFSPLVPATQGETPVLDVQAGGTTTVTINAGARDVEIPQVSHTNKLDVTIQNRGYNYVFQHIPLPAPRTLVISYRSQGKWYTVRDAAGDGTLTGEGSGSISYVTGSSLVTLNALPDVGTAILYAWSTGNHFVKRTAADIELPTWRYTLANPGIEPGTVTITWPSGGVQKSATDDGAGAFTGDGTGRIIYATGELYLVPTALPDPGSTPQVDYQYGAAQTEDFHPTKDGNGFVEVITAQSIRAGSLMIKWDTIRQATTAEKMSR